MPFFRVATEGATTDGRNISRDWITQMAGNYDPKKYGARVWMEHMRGMFADGPFPALGDVKALKAEEVDGKMALFADIDPTDRLKEINGQRQKLYTSIEVNPDFAGSGEAYLQGLAVTDSPASLGTEMLKFSAQAGAASPLASRKTHPDNLFSEGIETALDFTEQEEEPGEAGATLLNSVKALFTKHTSKNKLEFGAFKTDLEQTLALFVEKHSALAADLDSRPTATAFKELSDAHAATKSKLDELYTKLDNQPDTTPRKAATGGDGGTVQSDC